MPRGCTHWLRANDSWKVVGGKSNIVESESDSENDTFSLLFSAWVSECIFLQVFKWILFIYSMLAALNRCFFVPFCTVCTVYSWGSLKLDLKELKLQISQNESLYYRRKAPFILHIRLYNQMPVQSIFYLRSCNELITFLFWQMVQ